MFWLPWNKGKGNSKVYTHTHTHTHFHTLSHTFTHSTLNTGLTPLAISHRLSLSLPLSFSLIARARALSLSSLSRSLSLSSLSSFRHKLHHWSMTTNRPPPWPSFLSTHSPQPCPSNMPATRCHMHVHGRMRWTATQRVRAGCVCRSPRPRLANRCVSSHDAAGCLRPEVATSSIP